MLHRRIAATIVVHLALGPVHKRTPLLSTLVGVHRHTNIYCTGFSPPNRQHDKSGPNLVKNISRNFDIINRFIFAWT